jgi:hypothetical protein
VTGCDLLVVHDLFEHVAPEGALLVFARDGVRTRARLPDLTVEFRRQAETSWCGEVLGDGGVWICSENAVRRIGAIADTVHVVPIPIRSPWGTTVGADGRLWVVGDSHDDGQGQAPVAEVVSLDPTDPSTLQETQVQWRGTMRDVAALPGGVAVATWSGTVYFVDDAGVVQETRDGRAGRAQTIAVSSDGWLEGFGPLVAVGQDFGQVDILRGVAN